MPHDKQGFPVFDEGSLTTKEFVNHKGYDSKFSPRDTLSQLLLQEASYQRNNVIATATASQTI